MSTSEFNNLRYQADKLQRHNKQGSYKTKERYFEAYARFLRFAANEYHLQKIANVHPKHLHAYVKQMQERDLAASTIKTDLATIRFWHDKISKPRYSLPDNSAFDLERRKFGGVDRAWTENEYRLMLELCEQKGRWDYAACITLARQTGLRIHEVLRIDTAIAHQAVKTNCLTIKGKGGKLRVVPINQEARQQLEQFLVKTKPGHKLFVPMDMQSHIAKAELQNFINRHRAAIQERHNAPPLTFHGLRHSYAVEQYQYFRNIGLVESEAKRRVSELIGHNRADVSNIYLASVQKEDTPCLKNTKTL